MILTGLRYGPYGAPEPVGGRTTVLEDDFAPGFDTRINWITGPSNINGSSVITVTDHPSFNGAGGVDVTFDDLADPGDRWAGRIGLPSEYDEAWFTFDFMFDSGWSSGGSSHTGKFPGLAGANFASGCNGKASEVNLCADGWSARHAWGEVTGGGEVPMGMGLYHVDKEVNCGEANNYEVDSNRINITRGEVHTIEQYVKVNTAHDAFDGIIRCKLDGVLAFNRTNLRFYCDNEGNRSGIGQAAFRVFYGGSGPNWSPSNDSTFTFGAFKVEIPT